MGKKMGKGRGKGAGGGGSRRSQADERGAATKSNWIRFKNPTPDHVRRPTSSHPSLSSAWFPFSPLLFSRNPAANVLFLLLHCLGFFPIGFLLFKLTLVLHLPPSSIHPLACRLSQACLRVPLCTPSFLTLTAIHFVLLWQFQRKRNMTMGLQLRGSEL